MKIEELVKNAIEEFGDRAHERFSVAGIGFVDCKSNDDLTNHDFYIIPKSLPELFSHGCDVYGFEQEVKMWEFYSHPELAWVDFGNCNYEDALKTFEFFEVSRKKSAAREFCLDDAKAGDVVEMLKNGEWLTGKLEMSEHSFFIFHGKNFGTGGSLKNAELRMKFPKKVRS